MVKRFLEISVAHQIFTSWSPVYWSHSANRKRLLSRVCHWIQKGLRLLTLLLLTMGSLSTSLWCTLRASHGANRKRLLSQVLMCYWQIQSGSRFLTLLLLTMGSLSTLLWYTLRTNQVSKLKLKVWTKISIYWLVFVLCSICLRCTQCMHNAHRSRCLHWEQWSAWLMTSLSNNFLPCWWSLYNYNVPRYHVVIYVCTDWEFVIRHWNVGKGRRYD